MRKTDWARSGNGPDILDVSTAMEAIGRMHGVSLSLVLQQDGKYGSGGVSVTCIAQSENASSGGVRSSVSRKRRFPSDDAQTLEGLLMRLLYEIDYDCTAFWQQERIPDA